MEEVDNYTSSIAAAVAQQTAASSEISENVLQAAQGTQSVSSNMAGVNDAVLETNESASQVLTASESVIQQTNNLREEIASFLRQVEIA